ncbi:hypothetical protein FBY03_11171 [Pseudomonas sp. SJZ079]|uniref:helix-turn-helix domain-containing protein n=1 Tax=Pseudomonas sp. SJZ079 TaxID=2572887 RepID=UPI00119BE1F0|nr:helix-turn-helix domain-containing protein [Pseudomonas sp. SJZ079]TWC35026.1 hypothetical protein FBY03_11171 [Pseudomonas sp. SJZ079]
MDRTETQHLQRFADYLKFWRGVFGLSQEQLAEMVGTSTRHVTRLKNGISRSSEVLTDHIADALKLGRRDRSHLRIAAGYATNEIAQNFNGPDLKWLRSAMLRTLQALAPYPSTLTDGAGNILMVNKAWVGFYQDKVDTERLRQTVNLYNFLFNDDSDGALSEEWKDTLSLVIMVFKQHVMLNGSDQEKQTLKRILGYPSTPRDWKIRASRLEPRASFKVKIQHQEMVRGIYSVSQTVGAPDPAAYMTEPRLSINTPYPEDAALSLEKLLLNPLEHPLLFY